MDNLNILGQSLEDTTRAAIAFEIATEKIVLQINVENPRLKPPNN